MSKASEIYDIVKQYAGLNDVVLCDVHKCLNQSTCSKHQTLPLLDYDKVKRQYCINNRKDNTASVDGLCFNKYGILFFVEAKGWQTFFHYQHPQNNASVNAQVNRYDFQGKLASSLKISQDIINASYCLPIVYVIVTDTDTPEDQLLANLNILAGTASDLSTAYTIQIKQKLTNVSDVDTFVVDDCQSFDSEINKLTNARQVQL